MPTLDDMRRWMAGEDVPGLPARSLAWDGPRSETKPKRAAFWNPDLATIRGVDIAVKGATYERVDSPSTAVVAAMEGALPPPPIAKGIDFDRLKKKAEEKHVRDGRLSGDGKCKLTTDGKDGVLTFGKFSGEKISEIAKDHPGYLSWIIEKDKTEPFPPAMMEVVRRHYFAARGRLKLDSDGGSGDT